MIDQEIRDALKVEPSPEFVARVRTRIAAEPAPSGWRWSWTLAGSAAMAAALVLAVVVTRPPASPVAQPFRAASGDDAGLKPRATSHESDDSGVKPRATSHESVVFSHESVVAGFSRTGSPLQQEVLVNAAEMHALQKLIAAARNDGVALTMSATAPPAPMELEPVTDIVIAPITIDPIAPLSGAEGERP